jgi:ubiquinone/menaquinone biosynthesis C-methylase UbiE
MTTETKVAGHYTRGRLEGVILQAMARAGKDPAKLTAEDLIAIDEFHVGGIESTQALAEQMDLRPGMRLLDVGSGIGGPARYFAEKHGCQVTGVDLTDEFVQVARSLTRLVKLDDRVQFHQASALALPFAADSFERAYMIHVGMNVADKAGLCREVRRVLKRGGVFTVFDFVRSREGAVRYPVPWAQSDETSFVAGTQEYREALENAGFQVVRERNRAAFAIEATKRVIARVAQSGPPALGLQLLMGEKTGEMIGNILRLMEEGILEPVEFYARADGAASA